MLLNQFYETCLKKEYIHKRIVLKTIKDGPKSKNLTKCLLHRGKDTEISRTLVSRERSYIQGHKQFIISVQGLNVELFKAFQYLLFGISANQCLNYCYGKTGIDKGS